MSLSEAVQAFFLAVAVGAALLSCVGLCAMRSVFDRLHYLPLVAVLSPWSLLIAVLVRHSSVQAVIKMLILTAIVTLVSPILTHATAEAALVRQRGSIEPEELDTGDTP